MILPYQLAKSLQRGIEGNYLVVPRPDHPMLIAGPDILIGGEGNLTAVFFVSKSTRVAILRARVIAARLALPVSSSMVAFAESYNEGTLGNCFGTLITLYAVIEAIGAWDCMR